MHKKEEYSSRFIKLSELAKEFSYSQAYLSSLARRGKISAQKIGKDWYATHDDLLAYFASVNNLDKALERDLSDMSVYIPLSEASNYVPYSQEYLSLLARRGKLPAKKLGRNWHTTIDAVQDYYKQNKEFKTILAVNSQSIQGPDDNIPDSFLPESQAPQPARSASPGEVEPSLMENYQNEENYASEQGASEISEEHFQAKQAIGALQPTADGGVPQDAVTQSQARSEDGVGTSQDSAADSTNINHALQPDPHDADEKLWRETFKELRQYLHSKNSSEYSLKKPFFRTVAIVLPIIILLILFAGLGMNVVDKSFYGVRNFFKNATTVQGYFPGTHARELLVLNGEGNIDIYGDIQTKGQILSEAPDGVAPLVVYSQTTVENFSAQYLDGIGKENITLSFVTENGAVTEKRVKLLGGAEISSLSAGPTNINGTLSVSGPTNIYGPFTVTGTTTLQDLIARDSITRDLSVTRYTTLVDLSVENNAVFNKNVTVLGKTTLSEVDFTGDLTVEGKTNLNDTIVAGNLDVYGNTNIQDLWASAISASTLSASNISSSTIKANTGFFNFLYTDGFNFGQRDTVSLLGEINTKTWYIRADGTSSFPTSTITNLTATTATITNLITSGSSTFDGNLVLSSPYGITLNAGNITGNQLSAPGGLSATATTGGTLLANTYYYIITALNANGETISSSEASAVVDGATTTAVDIIFNEVSGATSYRIYGRAQGAQNIYFTVTESTGDDEDSTVAFADTGASGTSGTVPTINTTGGSATFAGNLTASGVIDFGGAISLTLPNSATPIVNAVGEIALDTTIADHTGLIKYYDSVEEITVIGVPTGNLTTIDSQILRYNATNNEFEFASVTSSGAAPDDAQYVTLAINGTLTNERVLTGTANQIIITDNGAGSTIVLSTPQDIATSSAVTFATLDTGQGPNDLFDMDQNVLTTSAVTFAGLTSTGPCSTAYSSYRHSNGS